MTRERSFRKRLGQYICHLSFGWCGMNEYFLALHVLPEMMIGLVDVFGPGSDFGQSGEFQSTAVVLKNCTVHFWWQIIHLKTMLPCLLEHPDRIPSTTPGAEPPRDAKDSGSARPHSTHPETSSTNRP